MDFRTQIEIPHKPVYDIRHDDSIVMLGSCFTDNVGTLLKTDGFKVTHNPMGPLYNPVSIYNAIRLALSDDRGSMLTVTEDSDHRYHCLDFASRFVYDSREHLTDDINARLDTLGADIRASKAIILTLGTAYVFRLKDRGTVVGNCHKFAGSMFSRELLTFAQAKEVLHSIKSLLNDKTIIYTVSPIRHTADGMHGNQISKSTLLMAIDGTDAIYFPAYEIMMDDLRDYRFYAEDMKHPSTVAVDYIYEIFGKYFFTADTITRAASARRESKRQAHRPIIANSKP